MSRRGTLLFAFFTLLALLLLVLLVELTAAASASSCNYALAREARELLKDEVWSMAESRSFEMNLSCPMHRNNDLLRKHAQNMRTVR